MKKKAKNGFAFVFVALVVVLGPIQGVTHPRYEVGRNSFGRWVANQGGLLADLLRASEVFVTALVLFTVAGVLLNEARDRI